jgi:hypothetical protein
MAAPAGSNALSLGRQVIDLSQFGPDVPDSVRHAFQQIQDALVGMGWPCGARGGDTAYQAVLYADNKFWGGKPSDPTNPDELLNTGGTTAQKVIWGIDPDGGHTLTTTGTTLTLALKVTKYTFDAVNFVSAVDATVSVTYNTGTECA